MYIYTDGIPEAENEERQIIGFEESLMDIFRRAHRPGLGETLDAVLNEVKRFTGNRPIDDDIVIIGIEVAKGA